MVVNCEQVWREISSYVDGDVEPGLRAAMDDHFRGCKRCVSVLAGMRNVIRLYGDERMMEVPSGFGRRLERRLAANVQTGGGLLRWSAWLVPVAAVALLAVGLKLANSHVPATEPPTEHAQSGKNIPPDLVVVVAEGTKVFHVPTCTFIHHKEKLRTLTARQALQEGFTPCPRCLRKYLEVARGWRGNPAPEDEESESRGPGKLNDVSPDNNGAESPR